MQAHTRNLIPKRHMNIVHGQNEGNWLRWGHSPSNDIKGIFIGILVSEPGAYVDKNHN